MPLLPVFRSNDRPTVGATAMDDERREKEKHICCCESNTLYIMLLSVLGLNKSWHSATRPAIKRTMVITFHPVFHLT